MTLEELKNKKVTITVNKTFALEDDLDQDILPFLIEVQKDLKLSDKELLDRIEHDYYSNSYDIADTLNNMNDYKITIHD